MVASALGGGGVCVVCCVRRGSPRWVDVIVDCGSQQSENHRLLLKFLSCLVDSTNESDLITTITISLKMGRELDLVSVSFPMWLDGNWVDRQQEICELI